MSVLSDNRCGGSRIGSGFGKTGSGFRKLPAPCFLRADPLASTFYFDFFENVGSTFVILWIRICQPLFFQKFGKIYKPYFQKRIRQWFFLKLVSGNFLNPETGSLLLFVSGSGFSGSGSDSDSAPSVGRERTEPVYTFLLALQTRITCDMLRVTN
jgi:hypothetical protein